MSFSTPSGARLSLEERLLQQMRNARPCEKKNSSQCKLLSALANQADVSLDVTELAADVPAWKPSADYMAAEALLRERAGENRSASYSQHNKNDMPKIIYEKAARIDYGDTLIRNAKEAYTGDKLKGSFIGEKEFVTNLERVGVDRSCATRLFASGDKNHDGVLDGIEYLSLIERRLTLKKIKSIFQQGRPSANDVENCNDAAMQTLLNVFRHWDQDGQGIVSTKAVTRIVNTLNPDIVLQSDIEKLLKEIDVGQDGQADFCDWVSWLYADSDARKTKAWLQNKNDADGTKLANLRATVQRKRAEEARAQGRQKEYEMAQHQDLQVYLSKMNMKPGCNTLNHGPGARGSCKKCSGYHFWFCHYCGYINYWGSCLNGCQWAVYGWSCVSGKCDHSGKCGCKCSAEYLRKHGYAMDTRDTPLDIEHIHDVAHATQEAAVMKKDVVAVAFLQRIEAAEDGFVRLHLSKMTGDEFDVVVPAGARLGAITTEILRAGSYAKLLELKLVTPGGETIGEADELPKEQYLGDVIRAQGDAKSAVSGYEKAASTETVEEEEKCITLQIQLMSGDHLFVDAKVPVGSTVASVRKLATKKLRESAGDAKNEVSALVSAEFGDLIDACTVTDCGLVDGSILTAVITEEVDELQQIETLFHGLIMDRMHCREHPSTLTDKGFVFPSLKEYTEKGGESWLPVPGMYGGFNTHITKDETSSLKLVTESWSRVCEGSGQRHEITVADGVQLVAQGFV